MPTFTPLSDDYEVLGAMLQATLYCINSENIQPYLEKHGLAEIDPNAWYPYQRMLDVYNEMMEEGSHMLDFVSIGMKLAEILPPTAGETFLEKLKNWSADPAGVVRASDYGYFKTEVIGEKSARIHYRQAAPDDLGYGMIYGLARRDSCGKLRFALRYADSDQRRDYGAEETVFLLDWD